ncbi:MAG: type II secretion system protein [bacterium]
MNKRISLRSDKLRAFTLIELLVVIVIIMILSGLLMPVFTSARTAAKNTKAKNDVKQIEIAWKAVLSDYRTWTLAGVAPGDDLKMDSVNVAYLQGQGANTKQVLYMEFPVGTSSFLDPWKVEYHFALGVDSISPPGYGKLYRDVGAWSYGKNSSSSITTDHVTSWK